MENILEKKKIIGKITIFAAVFTLGILFDHFLLYPYFNIRENKEIQEVSKSETNNTNPVVTSSTEKDRKVEIEKTCKIHVDASGALKQPGVFCLEEGSMIIDVVNKAGGFSKDLAYKFVARKINLSQRVVDNQKIYFPFESEVECTLLSFLPQTKEVEIIINNNTNVQNNTSEQNSNPSNPQVADCININSANENELDSLEGVGPAMAKKIIEGRPYSKIEDLLRVSGIGETIFAKFKEKICI